MKKRIPRLPNSFSFPVPQDNDEYICNGLFCFNISLMNDDIINCRCDFSKEQTAVSIWRWVEKRSLKDEYVEVADLSQPVILAEISPDKLLFAPDMEINWIQRGYSLLDGHHRIEKATQQGIEYLDAYILPMESHIQYMYRGFDHYLNYWNDKWKTLLIDAKYRCTN